MVPQRLPRAVAGGAKTLEKLIILGVPELYPGLSLARAGCGRAGQVLYLLGAKSFRR